jgi:hypothetical protein
LVILHSVREKEDVPLKRKGPSSNRRGYIVKNKSVPLLPYIPGGSGKHFIEERLPIFEITHFRK